MKKQTVKSTKDSGKVRMGTATSSFTVKSTKDSGKVRMGTARSSF